MQKGIGAINYAMVPNSYDFLSFSEAGVLQGESNEFIFGVKEF
jgi:hypothetical protein